MIALVARRALAQRRLVVSVVLLVAVAAGLVGVCSLLLGPTQDRAFHAEVQRSQPQELDVTAYLVELAADDVADARDQARRVVRDVYTPLRPTISSATTARMRRLDGGDRLAYLATDDALARRAELVSGRWPADAGTGPSGRPAEATLPATAARALGLRLGDTVTLGQEIGVDGVATPVDVVVVGTFRPTARADWETDPLHGAGVEPAYSDGSVTAPAYGPFEIGDAAFLATGSSVTGLRVTARPTLALATDATLRDALDALDHASALLSSRVGDRARITRVGSDLPDTLDRIHAQQATTRAGVLVLLLLGTALAGAAALLAGWLVASVRDDERALLVALGLSRRQQVGAAAGEALVLAVVAAVLAAPAAAVAHSRLTHLPALRAAGLGQPPDVTWPLTLTVLASAVLLASALVVTALDTGTAPDRTSRRRAAARSGLDVLLLAVAVLGWWQLRSQSATTTGRVDLTLTAAPVLCITAVTVVAVRLVPPLLAGAARVGVRSRGLVLPLAAQQAARRPHTGTAMVLVAAAVAAAVFGLSLRTTWERSQDDQAAVRVGADLALTLAAPAGPQEAAAVAATTAGQGPGAVVSPVVDRPLALGRYVGDVGSPPLLVAVDSRQAGALLRGRLEAGTGWSDVGATLAPGPAVRGLALPDDGRGVRLVGDAPPGSALTVTPTVVVQDASGFRSSIAAAPIALDGRSHRVEWLGRIGSRMRLVGVRLRLDGSGAGRTAEVSVALRLPGGRAGTTPTWPLRSLQRESPVRGATVTVTPDAGGVVLRTTATLDVAYFAYTGADVLATAFTAPPEVPVAVSQDLADAVGVSAGGQLSAIVGGTALPLRVRAVVPTVPSAPGRAAVLADADTLSRALIGAGHLEPVVDGWWVAHPTPATVRGLQRLGLGDVTTRRTVAAELSRGPLRVTVPTTLIALVVAATVMLLAGVGLVLSSDRQRREAEVARLRALGLGHRGARRLLLAEHGALLVPLVLLGALVGVAAAVLLGPALVRSDVGSAPVPDVVVTWPWAAETLLVAGLLLVPLGLTAVATALHVRRADPARLRTGAE